MLLNLFLITVLLLITNEISCNCDMVGQVSTQPEYKRTKVSMPFDDKLDILVQPDETEKVKIWSSKDKSSLDKIDFTHLTKREGNEDGSTKSLDSSKHIEDTTLGALDGLNKQDIKNNQFEFSPMVKNISSKMSTLFAAKPSKPTFPKLMDSPVSGRKRSIISSIRNWFGWRKSKKKSDPKKINHGDLNQSVDTTPSTKNEDDERGHDYDDERGHDYDDGRSNDYDDERRHAYDDQRGNDYIDQKGHYYDNQKGNDDNDEYVPTPERSKWRHVKKTQNRTMYNILKPFLKIPPTRADFVKYATRDHVVFKSITTVCQIHAQFHRAEKNLRKSKGQIKKYLRTSGGYDAKSRRILRETRDRLSKYTYHRKIFNYWCHSLRMKYHRMAKEIEFIEHFLSTLDDVKIMSTINQPTMNTTHYNYKSRL